MMGQVSRWRWEPAIYEHKAALLGLPVLDVATSAAHLAAAVLREAELYDTGSVVVGIDIYNLEAEACGGRLTSAGPRNCPELVGPGWSLDLLPAPLTLPPVPAAGRFRLVLEAGQRVRDALPGYAVRIAASGPVAIAAKLVGLEALAMALALDEEPAQRLLDFTTDLAAAWCRAVRDTALDVIVFDSMASPPLISPTLYRRAIAPRHARLMDLLAARGQADRPLILGGDTTAIAADLAATGATSLVCDFTASASRFAAALPPGHALTIRRNLPPGIVTQPPAAQDAALRALCAELALFPKASAGTGILPYDTPPDALTALGRRWAALTAPGAAAAPARGA